MFCVSIALAADGKPVLGAAYDPLRDELFTAIKGGGAFLNGNRIRVANVSDLDNALLATGFPYDIRTNRDNNLDHFNRVVLNCQAIRRAGSAVLDLCYTACGRFDGFWEQSLFAWDMAAGALIVEEAGGVVTDMKGNRLDLFGKTIAAANTHIHPKLLELLRN
jgi:myo-inositol-1(or 4)-monophosphatase